jgi:hypothetical protein
MNRKVFFAAIYAATSLSLAVFLDAFYWAGPVTPHLGLARSAIGGSILFAIACVASLFDLRSGVACAVVASILCWPFFGGELSSVIGVWRSQAAVLTLTLSSAYTLSQLRRCSQVRSC